MRALFALLVMFSSQAFGADAPINPIPRSVLVLDTKRWDFDKSEEGWASQNQSVVRYDGGSLCIKSQGEDPFLHIPVDMPGGQILIRMRAKGTTTGAGTIFWTTDKSPRGEDKTSHFLLKSDGQWHEYETRFTADGRVTDVRLDPGSSPGDFEIDWMELIHEEPHPLTIDRSEQLADCVRFFVSNHRATPLSFAANGTKHEAAGSQTVSIDVPLANKRPLEQASLEITADGLPPVRRTVFVHNPSVQAEWLVQQGDGYQLRIARDGSMARIERGEELLAIIAPLVHRDDKMPSLKLTKEGPSAEFEGDGVRLTVQASNDTIQFSVDGKDEWVGPSVRVVGGLEQGLLAGLEYLGKGERSSTTIDVETEEHLRFAPDPLKVTMPLMAYVTDKTSVAMTWTDMALQPLYATPNFFDNTDDHFMSLRGKKIDATIRVTKGPLEEAILWAVKQKGLPPVPAPPRTVEEQYKLCLQALSGPLKTAEGWGHCAEESWPRHFFSAMPSTIFRLTGELPDVPKVVRGGSHVDNDAVFFLTGRAEQWRNEKARAIQGLIAAQLPDGSYRYDGRFSKGHFENTASGICSHPASILLEYAWLTGDEKAREAGLKTLEFMKRFRTPRGAQTWEVPLHTPDQLASASLVSAYVRGFELTGNQDYLQCARKWAISGVPFTYLWGRYPVMLYGTPPVYGSTHWRGTCWMGRPVQWVGGVYAYALTKLAPYDKTLDWNQLARGILVTAEQMQYPDGPYAGLLPDAFDIAQQERVPTHINPCALVSLRLVLDGKLDSLAVASDARHRVVSPFPVAIKQGKAVVSGRKGIKYQLLVDGQRIIDVDSQGEDTVEIDPFVAALDCPILKEGEARTQIDMFVQARIPELKMSADAESWQRDADQLRQRVLDQVIFRGVPDEWRRAKPQVVWDETIATPHGYKLKKFRFEALPGLWIPAVLYEPDKIEGKIPVILNVNGHAITGKQTPYKQIRCINIAKRGMLALNLEWVGMGQLQAGVYSHNHLAMLDLCGRSGVSVFYLAMARGLDVLLDHPSADLNRVAVTGLSGGGWQTIILSSLDARVKLSVPVAGHSSLKQRIPNRGSIGDLEQNPVDLVSIADYAHLTAMMAPRPTLLIYNAKDDCCFVADTVKASTYDPVVPFFEQAKAAGSLEYYVNQDPGTHNYERDNRQQFYRFIHKHFLAGQSVTDDEIPSEAEVQTAEALHVPLPEGNANFLSLAAKAAESLPRQESNASPASRRERLRSLLRYSDLAAKIETCGPDESVAGKTISRLRIAMGMEWVIPAVVIGAESSSRDTLLIADAGFASAFAKIEELVASGSRVIAIDPALIGQARPDASLAQDAMILGTVGQRPLGIQVAQILASIEAYRTSKNMARVDMVTIGPRSGLVALCSAALQPEAFGRVVTEGMPDTLKAFLQPGASYDQTPEAYCFGLLEWFDRKDLEQLAAVSSH